MQWLKAGDANTKFFHLRASYRKSKNCISHLSDGNELHNSPGSIANYLLSFFRNQLGVELSPHTSIDFSSLFSDKSIDLSSLHSPFIVEEVKLAIFFSAPEKASEKASGLDGFSMLFLSTLLEHLEG